MNNNTCPICYNSKKNIILRSCKHSFCTSCINKWKRNKANPTCPICRKIIINRNASINLAIKNTRNRLQRNLNTPVKNIMKMIGSKLDDCDDIKAFIKFLNTGNTSNIKNHIRELLINYDENVKSVLIVYLEILELYVSCETKNWNNIELSLDSALNNWNNIELSLDSILNNL